MFNNIIKKKQKRKSQRKRPILMNSTILYIVANTIGSFGAPIKKKEVVISEVNANDRDMDMVSC